MWTSPAFYIAVVSLIGNLGNYLKSRTAHDTANKALTAINKAIVTNGPKGFTP